MIFFGIKIGYTFFYCHDIIYFLALNRISKLLELSREGAVHKWRLFSIEFLNLSPPRLLLSTSSGRLPPKSGHHFSRKLSILLYFSLLIEQTSVFAPLLHFFFHACFHLISQHSSLHVCFRLIFTSPICLLPSDFPTRRDLWTAPHIEKSMKKITISSNDSLLINQSFFHIGRVELKLRNFRSKIKLDPTTVPLLL